MSMKCLQTFACIGAVFMGVVSPAMAQRMSPSGPDAPPPAASLDVIGKGLTPGRVVTLATGPKQQLTRTVDNGGTVTFAGLKYGSGKPLTFTLTYALAGQNMTPINNMVVMDVNPYLGVVAVKGNATRAASVIVNVSGEDSKAMVANNQGYFEGSASSLSGLRDGNSNVVASIVNVVDECCPRRFKPMPPVTFSLVSRPVLPAKKADLITGGSVDVALEKTLPIRGYGATVTVDPELINKSWVTGLYKFGNQVNENILSQTATLGGFIDAQNHNAAKLALQQGQARAANVFAPSEQLCRFATLSGGMAASDEKARVNKLNLSRALLQREMSTVNMIGAEGDPAQGRMETFARTFCDAHDNSRALRNLCEKSKDDRRFNRDVDYTRTVEAPSTINLDYTSSNPPSVDQQDIFALAENLFPIKSVNRIYNDPAFSYEGDNFRSLQAIRSVAKNSFVSLLAEKGSGSGGGGTYISSLLQSLGFSKSQADLLVGPNPSYFAQMEAITKRVFQDPNFYMNLIESPENVERQRAAMRAIKLQQQNDFAASVKRREMLLATLLELKLRERAGMLNQRSIAANNPK